MGYPIVESSPVALGPEDELKKRNEMPFAELQIGKSFLVPKTDMREQSVRNAATAAGKKLKFKFRVIKHGEPHNCYEVARIA
jgi:hypothetical protein